MALASVEATTEHARRAWNPQHSVHAEYDQQNYVVPNLAPRPFEVGDVNRPQQQQAWRTAPAPPPDPALVVLRWMKQRPALVLMFAYAMWLGFWSLYALRALDL